MWNSYPNRQMYAGQRATYWLYATAYLLFSLSIYMLILTLSILEKSPSALDMVSVLTFLVPDMVESWFMLWTTMIVVPGLMLALLITSIQYSNLSF
jgi:hypothetical protein